MAYKDQKSLKDTEEERKADSPTRADLITSRATLFATLVDIVESGSGYPKNRVAADLTMMAMKGLHADPLARVLPVMPNKDG